MIRGGHASSKWSAPTWAVTRYVTALIATHGLDLVTTTECRSPVKVAALRAALGRRWAVRRKGEYVVCWRRSVFKARRRSRLIRMTRVYSGLHQWRDAYVAVFYLTHRPSGRFVRVEPAHLPAGVESGDQYRATRAAALAVAASRAALHRWGVRNDRTPEGVVLINAFDGNLDQSRPPWLAYMQSTLGLSSIWAGRVPEQGTHGRRLIDTVHTNARVVDAEVSTVPRPRVRHPSRRLDHVAIVYTLDL